MPIITPSNRRPTLGTGVEESRSSGREVNDGESCSRGQEGQRLSYAAMRPGSAFLACLLVPWFLALQLLSYKARSLERIDWVVFMAVIVLPSLSTPAILTWSDWPRPILPAGVLLGGRLCFLLVLRLAARNWSIDGQRSCLAH